MEVGGAVAPGFEAVRDAFAKAQEADPGGAQLCVYRKGEVVLTSGPAAIRPAIAPTRPNSITVLMSCTKALTAICALMLAQRGQIDLEAPIAGVWPEFAARRRRARSPSPRFSATPRVCSRSIPTPGSRARDELDFAKGAEALAAMAPLWPPGGGCFYHFVTFGFLVGEVVRRVTGKTLGTFFADEIAGPLGLDLWIGLPEAQEDRVALHQRRPQGFSAEQWGQLLGNAGLDPEGRFVRP